MRTTWTPERLEALRHAHASKSYKLTHSNFKSYCQDAFGINLSFAYALLSGKRNIKQQIQAELRWEIWERDDFRCLYMLRGDSDIMTFLNTCFFVEMFGDILREKAVPR